MTFRWRTTGPVVAPALLLLALAATLPAALPNAEGYISAGLKAYKDGNSRAAGAEFRKGIALKPDSLDAHYYLGRVALAQKDHHTAFNAFKEVLALQKDFKNTAELFRKLVPLLLEQVKSELKVNPRSARAYNVLGFLLLYQQRTNEGITQLEYALRFDPSLATAYDDLAWAYYQSNRFEAALKYSEKAFTLDPVRASITRHYQQLFYLKRLNFAADQANPERFYARPEPEKPAAAGVPAGGEAAPPASGAATGTTPAVDDAFGPEPPAFGPAQPVPPDATVVPAPPDEISVPPTSELTQIQIDDSAIVSALLKDYKPNVVSGAGGPGTTSGFIATSGGGTAPRPRDGPPKDAPPSAAEIAARVRALYKKGKELASKADFEGAQQAFELIIQVDPAYRDAVAQLELMRRHGRTKKAFDSAMEFYQTGAFAAALEVLRGIDLKTLREFRNVQTLDHLVGECYFHTAKFDKAAEKLASYCVENPQDVKFRYLLAKAYAELKEPRKALTELSIIRSTDSAYLAGFPESRGMRMKLTIKAYFPYVAGLASIWSLLSLGYFAWKVRQQQAARRLKATLVSVSQAQKEEDWGKLLETCEQYEVVAGKAGGDVRLRQSKALALVQLGRFDQAGHEVDALPDDGKRQLLRAKIRLEMGDVAPEALSEYRFLLGAEPNNLKLLQLMNQIQQSQGAATDEAERILERLIELEPLKGEYVSQLAAIHLGRESWDGSAQQTFQKLLTQDPSNVRARFGLARCHFASSHFVEAIREAKPLIEYDLDNPRVHEILVESYKSLGMTEEGEREYKRWLAAHPGNAQLADALERLRQSQDGPAGPVLEAELSEAYQKGAKLFSEGRFSDSVGPLSAAFDGHFQATYAGALLVRAYLKLGDPATALRVFERMDVYDQAPDEFLLALCYEMATLYETERKTREAARLYNFICRHNVNYRDAFQKLEGLQGARA